MSPGKYNFICFYLLTLLLFFSCHKKEKTYSETIAINDVKLPKAKPGDWRYSRDEEFQTFEDFQKLKKIKPEPGKNTVYLQPIGEFNELQKKEIELTSEYLSTYFQLQTKVLPVLSNTIFPKTVRRIFKDGQHQILAGYVLDSILIKRKPKDAAVLMESRKKIFIQDLNGIMFSASHHIRTVWE